MKTESAVTLSSKSGFLGSKGLSNRVPKRVFSFLILVCLSGCLATRNRPAAVVLEFRSGSFSPRPGLTEMNLPGSDHPVYVSAEVLLTNRDVKSARASVGPNGSQVDLVFTRTGAGRFAEATGRNLMQPIVILVDGQVLSAPIVRDRISGGRAVISGAFSEEEARRIADGIVGTP